MLTDKAGQTYDGVVLRPAAFRHAFYVVDIPRAIAVAHVEAFDAAGGQIARHKVNGRVLFDGRPPPPEG